MKYVFSLNFSSTYDDIFNNYTEYIDEIFECDDSILFDHISNILNKSEIQKNIFNINVENIF